MKKLLLIPTLATSVVAPIITTTSCSNSDGWIIWDFKENEEYDYKMSIPASTVSAEKAFSQYLDMIEQNPNDFAHEYMLSISKQIADQRKSPRTELVITTWKDELKIDSFDKKQKRISFSAKVERKYKRTEQIIETRVLNMIQTIDITCKNIPLQYYLLDGESAQWRIGPNTMSKDLDELKEILSKDKEWSVTGSVYVLRKTHHGEFIDEEQFGDKDFTYNYKTPSSSDWEKQVGKCCRLAYSLLDHPSYYMSNIPVPE